VTPGVVFSLAQAVRAFTEPGDAVLIQRPVYYPFSAVIEDNGRKLVNSPLLPSADGRYLMDFDGFERALKEYRPKMFLLCSPHNPVGRVWTKDELERVGDLCLAADCLIVSDEIHADFVYPWSRHAVFSTVKERFRARSVVCTSPSKTFNLAGLQVSNIIIENPALRRKYIKEINASGYSQPNVMGIRACQAAYDEGGPWLAELISYLEGNLELLRSAEIPGVSLLMPEGTYLPWLDFRATGMAQEDVDELLIRKAKVWLDTGTMFGPEGEGFQRINIACPRAILEDAINRIKTALS
jgi:cystathionine beta-lyase